MALHSWPVRFVFWLVICAVSAAPSFYVAASAWDEPMLWTGMLAGILVWVTLYTIVSGAAFARRLHRRRRVRRTLRIGYGTRVAMSIIFPLGLWADFWCGIPSIIVGGWLVGDDATIPFMFVTTVVQGFMLNVALSLYMLAILGLQRMFGGPECTDGVCERCGYDLRATTTGRCPECGLPVVTDPVTHGGPVVAETDAETDDAVAAA